MDPIDARRTPPILTERAARVGDDGAAQRGQLRRAPPPTQPTPINLAEGLTGLGVASETVAVDEMLFLLHWTKYRVEVVGLYGRWRKGEPASPVRGHKPIAAIAATRSARFDHSPLSLQPQGRWAQPRQHARHLSPVPSCYLITLLETVQQQAKQGVGHCHTEIQL